MPRRYRQLDSHRRFDEHEGVNLHHSDDVVNFAGLTVAKGTRRGIVKPVKNALDARKRAEKYGKIIGKTTITGGNETKKRFGLDYYPVKSSTTVVTNTGTGKGTTGKTRIIEETKKIKWGGIDERTTTNRSGEPKSRHRRKGRRGKSVGN